MHLLRRRNVHLVAAGTDGGDGLDDGLHRLLLGGEAGLFVVLRPLGEHQELALVRKRLPDLLRDERHERVQELERLDEDIAEDVLCVLARGLILAVEAVLRQLDEPVAVVVPDEVINFCGRDAELKGVHIVRDLADERIELREDPLVLELELFGQLHVVDRQVHHHEAARVPDLVAEVAHRLALFDVEAHVVARGVAGDEVEAQRVRAVLLGHLQRVDAVAERLGHLAALVVADEAVDEDGLERLLLHLLHAGEDHARDPEEDDIVARDHDGRGIPVLEVGRIEVGPAHRGERPERGGEPCIEHILLARQVLAAALFAFRRVFALDVDMAALVAVPRGDLVTPPQLAGNAPIMHVLHPIDIGLGEALRHELDRAVVHDADGLLGKRLHLDEPLRGDEGLDVVVAAIARADVVGVGLGLDEVALLF